MINRTNIILSLIYVFVVSTAFTQSDTKQRILFIGNSYTYFWNLPQNVASFAESSQIDLITKQSTSGGTNLGQHWRGEKALHSRDMIQSGEYTAVILQDHSMRAINAPDSLLYYGQLFGEEIKATGAQAYVYMTWARAWDPKKQDIITQKYKELAEKIDAKVVPVGPAWERARLLQPYLPLYDEDSSHPSTLGTYLTACVFYGILTQQSPVGLPHRLITVDKNGEKLYLNIQSKEDALFCQQVAEHVINEWKSNY